MFPSSMPKAILFDNDGVLVMSEPLHWEAWGKLLAEKGLPPEAAQDVEKFVGRTAPQILRGILDHYRPGWDPAEWNLEALALRKNDFYLASVPSRLKAYPGVLEGLPWLRSRGIRTAVVSNAKRRELDSAIDSTGLAPFLELRISRDEARLPKPDPTPYLMAAAELGIEPSDCLVVEDSPTGLAAGLQAGIPCVGVLSHFRADEISQPIPGRPDLKPVAVVASIIELFERLRALAD